MSGSIHNLITSRIVQFAPCHGRERDSGTRPSRTPRDYQDLKPGGRFRRASDLARLMIAPRLDSRLHGNDMEPMDQSESSTSVATTGAWQLIDRHAPYDAPRRFRKLATAGANASSNSAMSVSREAHPDRAGGELGGDTHRGQDMRVRDLS